MTPACNQCLNTKRTCPGYVARFDLILRDQTKAVRRKAQRRKETESTTSPSKKAASIQRRSSGDSLFSEWSTHGFNGSGDWVLIKKRSSSPEKSLPRMLNGFPEQQAICAFFLDFVLSPRHPDSVRGHLEHLAPMYQNASPESPLALATSSVALAMSGNSNAKPADQQLGKTTFGRALQKTSTAIRDPIQSIKDETLMAVLLLGLYEVCIHHLLYFLSSCHILRIPLHSVLLSGHCENPVKVLLASTTILSAQASAIETSMPILTSYRESTQQPRPPPPP